MSELPALLLSCAYVFAIIGVATALSRRGLIGRETARKLVHIGAAQWWFFLLAFLRSPAFMLAGPLGFAAVNLLSRRFKLFRVMEEASAPRNLGTIYFPLSLVILVLLVMGAVFSAWVAGVGVFVMGWGDALAALVGRRFGKGARGAKTLAGSLTMFLAAFFVVALMTLGFAPQTEGSELILRSLATALFAALVERATPWGLDNLSVPILTALFYRYAAEFGLSASFAAAAGFNIAAAAAAFRIRALTADGAAAAACVGAAVLFAGGLPAYALLLVFFLSSTGVGRLARSRIAPNDIEAKGGVRDELQVLANSAAALLALALYVLTRHAAFLVAMAGAFAAANADTWAGELGLLSPKPPRHLLSRQPLRPGSSGGVSLLGFAASAVGSVLLALVFALGYLLPGSFRTGGRAVLIVAAAGFFGAMLDSLLGAAFQAQYRSLGTGRITERPFESGRPNPLVRGLAWLGNDAVNALSTLAAAALAALAYLLV